MKYQVTDETGKQVIGGSNDLKEATAIAKAAYLKGLREYGIMEYFKVWNTTLGTLAYKAG